LYALANAFQFYEQAVQDGRIKSYGVFSNDSLRSDPDYIKQLNFDEIDPKTGRVIRPSPAEREKMLAEGLSEPTHKISNFEVQQLYETLDVARQVGGADHNLKFIQVPFNLSQNEVFTFDHLQKMPIVKHDQFTCDEAKTCSVLKACEELGVNLLTARSVHSGKLKDLPYKYSVGNGLRGSVPRML
jgi:hypothetical protein